MGSFNENLRDYVSKKLESKNIKLEYKVSIKEIKMFDGHITKIV